MLSYLSVVGRIVPIFFRTFWSCSTYAEIFVLLYFHRRFFFLRPPSDDLGSIVWARLRWGDGHPHHEEGGAWRPVPCPRSEDEHYGIRHVQADDGMRVF